MTPGTVRPRPWISTPRPFGPPPERVRPPIAVTERNLSLWRATTPETDHPPLSGAVRVDVAVVGGGITGLTAALLLKAAGARVAVIEARRIAVGTTGNTTAKVTPLHGLIYDHLVGTFGERRARLYADANRAGVERVASLARQHEIGCDLRPADAYTYTESPRRIPELEAEVAAATALGLPATLEREVPLPWGVEGAVRLPGGLLFHSRRYCLGLAAAIAGDGSNLFEHSRVTELEYGGPCVVRTAGGRVEADHAIVATLLPFPLEGGFFAKTHPSRSYAMAVRADGPAPDGMFLSADPPSRSVRPHPSDDGALLVIEGEEHKTGQEDDTEGCYRALERWGRERLGARSVEHRWSAQDFMSADRVPYVGRASARAERLLVATGFGKWGMSNGTAAAMMLSDLVLGRENPWLELFDAGRLKLGATTAQLVKENANVARRFLADRLATLAPPPSDSLGPGEGGIVEHDGERVAAYRDEDGRLTACSPVCTHLGCLVAWNPAERSWDCPCHGSRFDALGRVLEGPAVKDLERREEAARTVA